MTSWTSVVDTGTVASEVDPASSTLAGVAGEDAPSASSEPSRRRSASSTTSSIAESGMTSRPAELLPRPASAGPASGLGTTGAAPAPGACVAGVGAGTGATLR